MCKKQLNDDGIIVIASIRKKDKLLFVNSMLYFYCVFKSNEANEIEQTKNSRLCLKYFYIDIIFITIYSMCSIV